MILFPRSFCAPALTSDYAGGVVKPRLRYRFYALFNGAIESRIVVQVELIMLTKIISTQITRDTGIHKHRHSSFKRDRECSFSLWIEHALGTRKCARFKQ